VKARKGFPIVVIGPNANGTLEHCALITNVWPELSGGNDDTETGPVTVNAIMFPDGGGEPQFQNQITLHDSRAEAVAAGPSRRRAYWAMNS
jgi:hypothetical protein